MSGITVFASLVAGDAFGVVVAVEVPPAGLAVVVPAAVVFPLDEDDILCYSLIR